LKHQANRDLFAYWNRQRGLRPAPNRSEIDPAEIRQVLGDTFVLEIDGFGLNPFRLAGTRLCALFCRELKGESFLDLWQVPSQPGVRDLMAVVSNEKVGVVASAAGTTAEDRLLPVQLELLLLPLAFRIRSEARLIGAMVPMVAPYWLGAKPIGPLELGSFRHLGAELDESAERLVAARGRIRHGLTVYDGDRPN
jgi:hypothetical protein